MPIDNLSPVASARFIEDKIKSVIDIFNRREKLVALDYLYRLCDCRIDDIPHQISKALEAELKEKKSQ